MNNCLTSSVWSGHLTLFCCLGSAPLFCIWRILHSLISLGRGISIHQQGTGTRHHMTTGHTYSGVLDLGLVMHRNRTKVKNFSKSSSGCSRALDEGGDQCKCPGPIGTVVQAVASQTQWFQLQDVCRIWSWGGLALVGLWHSVPAQSPVCLVILRATQCPYNFLCFNKSFYGLSHNSPDLYTTEHSQNNFVWKNFWSY